MSELVNLSKDGDIAVVTINNPPVNALSPGVPEGILESVQAAEKDDSVKGIVLIGGGRTFIAGADIKEFGKITAGKKERGVGFNEILKVVEDCSKPIVAAVHGTAFGGGLETAMACHYRVAVPSAKVGQPEVKLGIIPGAGGTQRLPRLAGAAVAAEMCAFGNPISAAQAFETGIVDKVIEGDLLAGAVAFARQQSGPRKTRDLTGKISNQAENGKALSAVRAAANKRSRGLMAPGKAIDAVEAATKLPFDEGLATRAGTVHRVPVLRPVEGHDPRLLRRTGRREDSRHSQGSAASGNQTGRGRRRRHHGGRHHDELRQRRHPRAV